MVVDPRFPGGTSVAVASEIRALSRLVDLSVYALETAMFKGRDVHPLLKEALDEHGLPLIWGAPVVRADTVVFHNPSCLRFNAAIETRISCQRAFVVTHENFIRPNGSEGFDVATCLRLIKAALICGRFSLVPVSAHNRRGVKTWLEQNGTDWTIADFDWVNVCDLEMTAPTVAPRDRRGRHSRPGFEKFPPREAMLAQFPGHAERCVILGGDNLLLDKELAPKHWEIKRFREIDVASFFDQIDFFIYYTHPLWRESFGRVIAEAIAAGKVVITDPGTAEAFGDAVIASEGADIDRIVAGFIADPLHYVDFVRAAQASLARFRPEVFAHRVLSKMQIGEAADYALL